MAIDWMKQNMLAQQRRGNLAKPVGKDFTLRGRAEMASYPGARTAANRSYVGRDSAMDGINRTQKPDTSTILGMDRDRFSQLAGSLGAAIAGDTPMGRAGAAVSQFAGQKIERRQKVADTLAERQARIAAEKRGYAHDEGMQESRLATQEGLTNKRLEQDKTLHTESMKQRAELAKTASDERVKLADIRSKETLSALDKRLSAQGLETVVGDDGSINIVDKKTGTKKTVEGIRSKTKDKLSGQEVVGLALKARQEAEKNASGDMSGNVDPVAAGDRAEIRTIESLTGRTAVVNDKTGDVLYWDKREGAFYTALGEKVEIRDKKRMDFDLKPSHKRDETLYPMPNRME